MKKIKQEYKYILTLKEKKKIFGLVVMMIVGSALELLGVTLIMPLMNILIQNSDSSVLLFLKRHGFTSLVSPVIAMSLLVIIVYLIKNLYLYLMNKIVFRFIYHGYKDLSVRLLSGYLRENYELHTQRNMGIIQRSIRSDSLGCYQALKSILQFISELFVCFLLGVYLLLTSLKTSLLVGGLLLLVCGGYLIFAKKRAKKYGLWNQQSSGEMNQWIMQSMGGIKEVKLLGKETYFEDAYGKSAALYAKANEGQQMALNVPRLLAETVCIIGVAGLFILHALSGEDMTQMIPVLATFAVAAFRLLPSIGKMNSFIADFTFFKPSVHHVYEELSGQLVEKKAEEEAVISCPFQDKIEVRDLVFSYQGSDKKIFEQGALSIPRGAAVALVGPSGEGKTTLADIIMGLLTPTAGVIKVDGVPIQKNLRGWQKQIGYVPQNIYLTDDSIRGNVAFGEPPASIKEEDVIEALKKAQIYEFIKELPEGLDTRVGERGVRLSGGQRQRIGIARALYHKPAFLVFDEATSALDTETETAVMDAINHLKGEKTLLIIAHRLSTIENCDTVYEIAGGKIK